MKVVSFEALCISLEQAWDILPAHIVPENVVSWQTAGPTYCTQFNVRLLLERKHEFYIYEVFLATVLILCSALMPLGIYPSDKHTPYRLGITASGMLTLITFKYGIADQ